MPNIRYTVPNTKESVLRPIVLEIVRQLEWLTLIGTKTPITFPDEHETQYQPGSTIDDKPHEQGSISSDRRIYIEVDEDYDPANIYATAVAAEEHIPIFVDDKLGITMKPIYSPTNVRIAFRYKARSKTAALRWRDDIRTRTSTMRDINVHSVSYHYLIPEQFLDILKEVHRLRENQGGYGEDWPTYMASNGSTRITRVGNMSGQQSAIGVAETQTRIVGYFDFEYAPDKGDKEDDTPSWVTTFTYTLRFDKPIEVNLKYPAVIHNQVLSTKYRPDAQAFDEDQQWRSYSKSAANFKHFEMQDQHKGVNGFPTTLAIPRFDEFLSDSIVSGTYGVFTALCGVTPTEKRELLNLKELVDANLHPEIIRFLEESEWPYICKPYASILHCSLYRGFHLASHGNMECRANLDIYSKVDLSIRTSHRIRFSIVDDIGLLDPAALERLRRYPGVIDLIFKYLGINEIKYQQLLRQIFRNYTLDEFMKMRGIQKTVMVGSIIAHKTPALPIPQER